MATALLVCPILWELEMPLDADSLGSVSRMEDQRGARESGGHDFSVALRRRVKSARPRGLWCSSATAKNGETTRCGGFISSKPQVLGGFGAEVWRHER